MGKLFGTDGIRGIVGDDLTTELKNVVLFNKVQVPHYNYVGDSVLGYRAHMGAGSITSNFKSDKSMVKVHGKEEIETGLRKFGSIIGNRVEVGCNSVLCPGTIIYPDSIIYPLTRVRGVIEENTIMKDKDCKVKRKKI